MAGPITKPGQFCIGISQGRDIWSSFEDEPNGTAVARCWRASCDLVTQEKERRFDPHHDTTTPHHYCPPSPTPNAQRISSSCPPRREPSRCSPPPRCSRPPRRSPRPRRRRLPPIPPRPPRRRLLPLPRRRPIRPRPRWRRCSCSRRGSPSPSRGARS
jgi:hypothetical protein